MKRLMKVDMEKVYEVINSMPYGDDLKKLEDAFKNKKGAMPNFLPIASKRWWKNLMLNIICMWLGGWYDNDGGVHWLGKNWGDLEYAYFEM